MTHALPEALVTHALSPKLLAAVAAVRGAGAALTAVRGRAHVATELGDQLKTAVDRASEGWVLGYLVASCGGDTFLAEESYGDDPAKWHPCRNYWTVDALDGTRSYMEGFGGFTVQVSFVADGAPVVAAIAEPARQSIWVAIAGAGAYVDRGSGWERLATVDLDDWPTSPRFVDSTLPTGRISELMTRHRGRFVECGGVGAKALRVATCEADVFAKDFDFKLWDVAPVDLILRECGCRLGALDGTPISYDSETVMVRGVLAAPLGLFELFTGEFSSKS